MKNPTVSINDSTKDEVYNGMQAAIGRPKQDELFPYQSDWAQIQTVRSYPKRSIIVPWLKYFCRRGCL